MDLPLKPIPLPQAEKLIPPDLSRTYFDFSTVVPFEPAEEDFSLPNAVWLAEASFAAYDDHGRPPNLDRLTENGWAVSSITTGNVFCLALESADAAVLAFRGTRVEGFVDPLTRIRLLRTNWSDLVTDLNFPLQDAGNGRAVHRGFARALDTIDAQVSAAIRDVLQRGPAKKIWLTGHSLGGALATLAAERLAATIPVQGVYTYGSPRVGNDVFVNTFPVGNTYRFVHHRDVVTTVPPAGAFAHVGHLRYLTADGQLLERVEKESLLAHLEGSFDFLKQVLDVTTSKFHLNDLGTWPVPSEALADHAVIYYANELWNELVRSGTKAKGQNG